MPMFLVTAVIVFRAVVRPSCHPFIPKGGWLFCLGWNCVAAGTTAAVWLQSSLLAHGLGRCR